MINISCRIIYPTNINSNKVDIWILWCYCSYCVSLRKAQRAKKADDAKPERFSRKLTEAMHRIKLLAVREAVTSNPEFAFDLMLAALIEDRLAYGSNSPLAVRTNVSPVQVDVELLAGATMIDAEEVAEVVDMGTDDDDLFGRLFTSLE